MGPDVLKPRPGKRIGLKIILVVSFLLVLSGLVYYRASLTSLNQIYKHHGKVGSVSLRNLPYPYRAALGLTLSPGPGLTQEQFVEALRYLNQSPQSPTGGGLGLEVGGSIIFYPPSEEWMAYFNPSGPDGEKNRMVYNSLIRAGIVDVLDSYGQDVRFTREMAEQALKALSDQGLTLTTWADRFKSPDNIDSSGGRGGHKNRMAYHLDLTTQAGFRYFWLGRSTSLIGQNSILDWDSFLSLYDGKEMIRSFLGMFTTFFRHLAMVMFWPSEDPLRNNLLVSPVKLRDGSMGYEFIRYSPLNEEASLLSILKDRFLDRLTTTGGRSILNLVLRGDDPENAFADPEREALKALAARNKNGELMVTTASRLLDLTILERNLIWSTENRDDETRIIIEGLEDPLSGRRMPRVEELAGLTFYVPQSRKATLFLGEKALKVERNLIDHTGRESISLSWPEPGFPELSMQND